MGLSPIGFNMTNNLLKTVKTELLDLLFPKTCFGCGFEGEFLCLPCEQALHYVPPLCFGCGKLVPATARVTAGRTCDSCQAASNIYAFLSPLRYGDDLARDMIHSLKYNRVYELSRDLGRVLGRYCQAFRVDFPRDAVLMPIPLHAKRARRRGFNQSELIAGHFQKYFPEIPLEIAVLKRIKNTRSQIELSREERAKNISKSFAVENTEKIQGRDIVLLDDVKTTGATLEEAARVLKEAGAKKIWAITAAH